PCSGAAPQRQDHNRPDLEDDEQWKAFERVLSLLERRGNRVLVLVGPMNEDMMNPPMRGVYQRLKQSVREKLAARGVRFFMAPGLRTDWFSDICHPLGEGYAELARELLKAESAWLLQTSQPR
ncbi:MAG: hypothetical protein HY293_16325, partial [Planctomycetes bacterium]|nr:hypothetical protein [Planctomycetota bacterium]